jgi:malate dehydrogenase (oxaloacetate-decarboxylating)
LAGETHTDGKAAQEICGHSAKSMITSIPALRSRFSYEANMAVTPSASYSLIIRIRLENQPGVLDDVVAAIGGAGARIGAIDTVEGGDTSLVRDIAVDARDEDHWDQIIEAVNEVEGAEVVEYTDRTLRMHQGGKITQLNKHTLATRDDLSMAYTPGVARVCLAIDEEPEKAFRYTIKQNYVAVVTDGTAVLGLGDIGPSAALPVMEGKAMLFKEFADVDAFPICLDTTDPDEIVATVKAIAPVFGGINLEDISSPRCFEIEERLKEELDIPVFHDDQHGTAVVVMAALFNALKITGKRLEDLRIAMVGLGAAGIAVTRMLLNSGVGEIVGCDTTGAIYTERHDWDEMHPLKRWYAENTNHERISGGPADVLEGADLFIGLSGARVVQPEWLERMNDDAMVFAMANPEPEVMPEEAAPYARIIATGRSDYPNQINNVLCFPGIFRGALDAGATQITEEMKLVAAHSIADVIPESELSEDYIVPSVFNRDVASSLAAAVAAEARRSGAVRGDSSLKVGAPVD